MPVCNHDCFNCQFDDCICDDDQDAAESKFVESLLSERSGENKALKRAQAKYQKTHKDKIAAYQKAYRESRKQELAAIKRDWYQRNKAQVLAQQKAYRAKKDEGVNQ